MIVYWAVIGISLTLQVAFAPTTDEREVTTYQLPEAVVRFATFPDGLRVAYSNCGEIRILDLTNGKVSPVLFRNDDDFRRLEVTPDGKSLVFLGRNTTIRPLDAFDRPTFSLDVPFSRYPSAITPDGKFKPPADPRPIGPGLAVPCLSSDGKHIFAHDERSDIGIWDTDSDSRNRTIDGNRRPVNRLILSPDGKRLLVFTEKDFICWDVVAKKRLFKHTGPPGQTLFLPDSRTIFCFAAGRIGDKDRDMSAGSGRFQVLDADTGESRILGQAPDGMRFGLHAMDVHPFAPLVLTPDGKYVFVTHDTGSRVIFVVETKTGKEVATYVTEKWFSHFRITPDGKHLLIANRDKTLLRVPVKLVLESKPLTREQLLTLPRKQ